MRRIPKNTRDSGREFGSPVGGRRVQASGASKGLSGGRVMRASDIGGSEGFTASLQERSRPASVIFSR